LHFFYGTEGVLTSFQIGRFGFSSSMYEKSKQPKTWKGEVLENYEYVQFL
jgi:hypothetical protein